MNRMASLDHSARVYACSGQRRCTAAALDASHCNVECTSTPNLGHTTMHHLGLTFKRVFTCTATQPQQRSTRERARERERAWGVGKEKSSKSPCVSKG